MEKIGGSDNISPLSRRCKDFAGRYFRVFMAAAALLTIVSGFLPWFYFPGEGRAVTAFGLLARYGAGAGTFYFLLTLVFAMPALATAAGYAVRRRQASLALMSGILTLNFLFIVNLPGLYLSNAEEVVTLHIGAVAAIAAGAAALSLFVYLYGNLDFKHAVFMGAAATVTAAAFALDAAARFYRGRVNVLIFVLLIITLLIKMFSLVAAFVGNNEEQNQLFVRWDLIISGVLLLSSVVELIVAAA